MSKEQIEEMARDLEDHACMSDFQAEIASKMLYALGYRKQNGWISVNDRLPKEDERVLIYLESNRSYTKVDTDRMLEGKWVRWGSDVKYWMPLPELPKKQ